MEAKRKTERKLEGGWRDEKRRRRGYLVSWGKCINMGETDRGREWMDRQIKREKKVKEGEGKSDR